MNVIMRDRQMLPIGASTSAKRRCCSDARCSCSPAPAIFRVPGTASRNGRSPTDSPYRAQGGDGAGAVWGGDSPTATWGGDPTGTGTGTDPKPDIATDTGWLPVDPTDGGAWPSPSFSQGTFIPFIPYTSTQEQNCCQLHVCVGPRRNKQSGTTERRDVTVPPETSGEDKPGRGSRACKSARKSPGGDDEKSLIDEALDGRAAVFGDSAVVLNPGPGGPVRDVGEVVEGSGQGNGAVKRKNAWVFMAVLEYSCENEPKPKIEWWIRNRSSAPGTQARGSGWEPDSAGEISLPTAGPTIPGTGGAGSEATMEDRARRGLTAERKVEPTPGTGSAGDFYLGKGQRDQDEQTRALCYRAYVDTPTAQRVRGKEWMILASVTWEEGEPRRCFRMARVRLPRNPGSDSEVPANIDYSSSQDDYAAFVDRHSGDKKKKEDVKKKEKKVGQCPI